MSGKGDAPRPMKISDEEYDNNWNNISWAHEPEPTSVDDIESIEDLSNALSELHEKLLNNSKPMNSEYAKILNDNLWDLYET